MKEKSNSNVTFVTTVFLSRVISRDTLDSFMKKRSQLIKRGSLMRAKLVSFKTNQYYHPILFLKYLSPVSSMITFWVTTFWFLWNIKHHNYATFMNPKVVNQILSLNR